MNDFDEDSDVELDNEDNLSMLKRSLNFTHDILNGNENYPSHTTKKQRQTHCSSFSFLHLIPFHLQTFIFTQWIGDLPTLARIDSAMTNYSVRPIWLECLKAVRLDSFEMKMSHPLIFLLSRGELNEDSIEDLRDCCLDFGLRAQGTAVELVNRLQQFRTQKQKHYSEKIAWITKRGIQFESFRLEALLSPQTFQKFHQPNLLELEISGAYTTDASIANLLLGCPRLRGIYLHNCIHITDACVNLLSVTCPLLQFIDLSKCSNLTDFSIIQLARGCPNLRNLDLEGTRITDEALIEIAHRCPRLEWLLLKGCSQITDLSVTQLAYKCPLLQKLDLKLCWKVTDASLIILAAGCPNLQAIYLKGCALITDLSVQSLAEKCPKLTEIDLKGCSQLTDTSIIRLAQGCPKLKRLGLAGSDFITDLSLIQIAENCSSLKRVDIQDCLHITDQSIVLLAKLCIHLEQVRLHDCPEITDLSVSRLRDGCCKLKTLVVKSKMIMFYLLAK